ncbi:hypothetical protein PCANC_21660 [Puccinia coronata f. sp. avenae]|uniref:Uncharacterized protein n=1 Tax=Puccinia coronata f. sp. avenae TaxID=200324 RepID=A0A2N5SGV9_9BASI|nr:hypothetical protein PCANC_21660 [Puccinia coronata f. sp. avenae]
MELRRAITEVLIPKGDQSLPAHGPDESSYDELSTTEGGTVAPTDGAAPMETDELSTTEEGTPARETLVNKHATREQLNHGNSPVAIPAPGLHPRDQALVPLPPFQRAKPLLYWFERRPCLLALSRGQSPPSRP